MRAWIASLVGLIVAGTAGCGLDLANGMLKCASDGRCPSGYRCVNDVCWAEGTGPGGGDDMAVPGPGQNGSACSMDADCGSGNCVDQVCCNETAAQCNGCRACNLAGSLGTCINVSAGGDPHASCAKDDTKCIAGGCDGSGACKAAAMGTVCSSPVCASGQLTRSTCNGSSPTCPTPVVVNCPGNFACADGTSCRTSCGVSGDCANGYTCNAPNCTPVPGLGDACSTGNPCTSGLFCVDGVCCGQSSCPVCQACNLTTTKGSCAPVPAATADPHGRCTQSAATCTSATCNGAGACAALGSGVVCATSCTNGTPSPGQHDTATLRTRNCDGLTSGSCPAAQTPAACPGNTICASGSACRPSCGKDADCVAGYYCATNACVQRKGLGGGCTRDAECTSFVCHPSLKICTECVQGSYPYDYRHCPPTRPICDATNTCGPCTTANPGPTTMACYGHGSFGSSSLCQGGQCFCATGSQLCKSGAAPGCRPATNKCGCGTAGTFCVGGTVCNFSGTCKVAFGFPCTGNADCASQNCVNGVCQPPTVDPTSYCFDANDCPTGYGCNGSAACDNT
jgi:hypothetical protein